MKEFYDELAEMVSTKTAKHSIYYEEPVVQNRAIAAKLSKVASRHLNDEKI